MLGAQRSYFYWFGSGDKFVYFDNHLAVHFVDVRHGDCQIIQLPDGKIMVIDTGSERQWRRVNNYIQTRIKPRNNVIDYVIITHPHEDHNGGLSNLKSKYTVRNFIDYNVMYDGKEISTSSYRVIFHAIPECLIFVDTNEWSPIITLEYSNKVFIFTGDAGFPTENLFMQSEIAQSIFGEREEPLKTYLSVGHHGSANSSSIDFIAFVNPCYAVISVGTQFATLPNDALVQRLENNGIQVYSTRDTGDFVVLAYGDNDTHFYGFTNPINLTFLWVVLLLLVFFGCFIVWSKR